MTYKPITGEEVNEAMKAFLRLITKLDIFEIDARTVQDMLFLSGFITKVEADFTGESIEELERMSDPLVVQNVLDRSKSSAVKSLIKQLIGGKDE